jgi:predicted nucleotide-binding protein (sugar kinase/HSP70/actin superfamily)
MIIIYEINNFNTYKNLVSNILSISNLYDIIIIIINNESLLNFNGIKMSIEFIVNYL